MLNSFGFASRGLWNALAYERNFRLQWLLGLMVLLLLSMLNIEPWQETVLLLLVFLVLALELHNCAIEKTCDSFGTAFEAKKKHAKDYAAASVLVFSIGAAIIFISIIVPHISALIEHAKLFPNAYLTLSMVFLTTLPAVLMKSPSMPAILLLLIGAGLGASFIFISHGHPLFLVLGALFQIILLAALLQQHSLARRSQRP